MYLNILVLSGIISRRRSSISVAWWIGLRLIRVAADGVGADLLILGRLLHLSDLIQNTADVVLRIKSN